jgi:hypothetical protein
MNRLTDEQCSLLGKIGALFPLKDKAPDALEQAYKLGLIRKEDLEDGGYYAGHCRNAEVARWSKTHDCFIYMREKFRDIFPEKINHPANDNGFDLFIAFKKIDDNDVELFEVVHRRNIWNWVIE